MSGPADQPGYTLPAARAWARWIVVLAMGAQSAGPMLVGSHTGRMRGAGKTRRGLDALS